MKYTTEIAIGVSWNELIKKLDCTEKLKSRQPIGYELLSVTPGQERACMSSTNKMGKRNLEMVETIIKRNMTAHSKNNRSNTSPTSKLC